MLNIELTSAIFLANPWLNDPSQPVFDEGRYVQRVQFKQLLEPVWDRLIAVFTGPRQAGKTTLAFYLAQQLIRLNRYPTLVYLNCDELSIRQWLTGSHFLVDLQRLIKKETFILLLDEIQRLEHPGLILKSIHDLHLPIKVIATGSSQLELKSKVQEYLTGRHLESLILPLSYTELGAQWNTAINTIEGCYPQVVLSQQQKQLLLKNLYESYINKDIIEILKIKNADIFRQLLALIAHSSGQMVQYQQLAVDCKVSTYTITHYLNILENTYVLYAVKPFVGNKRTEITSNPIYYFIDNGFRNQALNNFTPLAQRTDMGLLVQSMVFQEIYKFKIQHYLDFSIHYWRTKSGAEVDFVLHKNQDCFMPVEVKYQTMNRPSVSRSFRSFLQAYQPKQGVILTKDALHEVEIEGCTIHFIPVSRLDLFFDVLKEM